MKIVVKNLTGSTAQWDMYGAPINWYATEITVVLVDNRTFSVESRETYGNGTCANVLPWATILEGCTSIAHALKIARGELKRFKEIRK